MTLCNTKYDSEYWNSVELQPDITNAVAYLTSDFSYPYFSTSWLDRSGAGYGHNAIIVGATRNLTDPNNLFGSALMCSDAVSINIYFARSAFLNMLTSFGFDMVFYYTPSTRWLSLGGKGFNCASPKRAWELQITPNNNVALSLSSDGNSVNQTVTSSLTLVPDKINHVSVSYNAGSIMFAVNGSIEHNTSTVTSIFNSDNQFRIGGSYCAATNTTISPFNNKIYRVIIYGSQMTEQQAMTNYNNSIIKYLNNKIN